MFLYFVFLQGHFIAGRAYVKLNRFHNAIEEYIEAYNIIAQLGQQMQVQIREEQQLQLAILQELTCLCSKKNSPGINKRSHDVYFAVILLCFSLEKRS